MKALKYESICFNLQNDLSWLSIESIIWKIILDYLPSLHRWIVLLLVPLSGALGTCPTLDMQLSGCTSAIIPLNKVERHSIDISLENKLLYSLI